MTEESPELAGLSEVTKRYADGKRRIDAIADVTLSIAPGHLCAVRGPSGSGKSTLLKLLGGLTTPTAGEVRLGTRNITRMRDHHRTRLRRKMVGIVFQDAALIPGMTVRDNVLLPYVPVGGARPDQRDRIDELLVRFGLSDFAGTRVERLSGGQRQRAALARAVALDPPLLLLDEPTAHLDADNIRVILDHLVSLTEDGRTVVVATHDPRLADDPRVDRVIRLVDGRLEA